MQLAGAPPSERVQDIRAGRASACTVHRNTQQIVTQIRGRTLSMWGKRKSRPECMPVPRPMDDRMPRPTHQMQYQNQTSARCSSFDCCPAARLQAEHGQQHTPGAESHKKKPMRAWVSQEGKQCLLHRMSSCTSVRHAAALGCIASAWVPFAKHARLRTSLLEEDIAGDGRQQQGERQAVPRKPERAARCCGAGARAEVIQRGQRLPEQAQALPLQRQLLAHLHARMPQLNPGLLGGV